MATSGLNMSAAIPAPATAGYGMNVGQPDAHPTRGTRTGETKI